MPYNIGGSNHHLGGIYCLFRAEDGSRGFSETQVNTSNITCHVNPLDQRLYCHKAYKGHLTYLV